MAFENIRKQTPCRFNDGISQQEFETMALKIGRRIKRITDIWIYGATVYCTVESQRHISEWNFSVDFNNWGHVTGVFWTETENHDSIIPHNYGMELSRWIKEVLYNKSVYIQDMAEAVDRYEDLDVLIANGIYSYKYFLKFLGDMFFGGKKQIVVYNSARKMEGEHLYPIFALLIDNGFKNISVQTIKDVNDKNGHYENEIKEVSIAGNNTFRRGTSFDYDSLVIITCHVKEEISIPFNVRSLKRQNRMYVKNRLQELGFTEIYAREIKDLVVGFVTKEGTTEQIVVVGRDGTESPIQNGQCYPYDTQIIIYYHTF